MPKKKPLADVAGTQKKLPGAFIYGLYDPRDGALRYIGKAVCLKKRLQGHMRDRISRKTPVYAWVNELVAIGFQPEIRVIQETDDWEFDERRLIALSRAQGDRLLNVADGGDEPSCPKYVRAANGRMNARAVHDDPKRKREWDLKRSLGQDIRRGLLCNKGRARLRELAAIQPKRFACFANIPDRMPDEAPAFLFSES